MRYGVVASFGSVEQVVEMAVAAEEAGWDGFFTWDGISVGAMDTFDPWALLGAVAVSTTRIRLGAMVFALARRHPWKVAREAITVDHLSGGRLVMPVGLGAVDDGAFSRVSGAPTERRTRAELLDDSLAILDLAWRGEPFSTPARTTGWRTSSSGRGRCSGPACRCGWWGRGRPGGRWTGRCAGTVSSRSPWAGRGNR